MISQILWLELTTQFLYVNFSDFVERELTLREERNYKIPVYFFVEINQSQETGYILRVADNPVSTFD